jgi:hypothetical protein
VAVDDPTAVPPRGGVFGTKRIKTAPSSGSAAVQAMTIGRP